MNIKRFWGICTIIGAAFVGAHASGDAVPVDDGRVVSTFSDAGSMSVTPTVPFADFDHPRQSSTLVANAFTGSGSGYGESDFEFLIIESVFDVTFRTTEATAIDLSGSFAAASGDFGFSEVTVRLYAVPGPSNELIYSDSIAADFEPVSGSFSFNGDLALGLYRLQIRTNITPGGFDTTGDWNFQATFGPAADPDSDGDGFVDTQDNCSALHNPGQNDADADGYGNRCDADFNNDCDVGAIDLGIFKSNFFSGNSLTDLNSDGIVNAVDLGLLKGLFFKFPGPSGLSIVCST